MDADRIALSRELADLAGRFMTEATVWKLPEARDECERTARHLAELSRAALTDADPVKLAHYATAAHLLANHLEGTRRFFKIILTPPPDPQQGRPHTMTSDPFNDPEARAWAQHAVDELVPKITDSAATVSILPDEAGLDDIKFALELGLSIMLDKPLLVAVVPGRRIPERLRRVADELIEFDEADPAGTSKRLNAAVARVIGDE